MAYTTIKKPSDYFNTKLYTGNGGTQSITDLGFQPDLTWIKQRGGTTSHVFYDAVRGAYWTIQSNTTNSQTADDGLTAWNSGGWNMGNVSTTNGNGLSYVGWNWKAGGGQGSSNTDGSINTTYTSANTTTGFSISKYTGNASAGATIGHGLGSVPKMVIVKKTNGAKDWNVYHVGMGATKGVYLNLTNAEQTHGNWNNTTPTNTVFSIGSDDQVNGSGQTYIAYCFAEKQGYSKFSSYIGNANVNGPFVYTGFKPAFVIIKRTNLANDWLMQDNKRYNINETVAKTLKPNSALAEGDTGNLDILSNGFKLRSTGTNTNASGGSYIYMAFAEQPLVGDNPATAR